MLTIIITASIACLIFVFCFGILMLKGRKGDQPVKLHQCGHEDDCQCRKKEKLQQQKEGQA